MFNKLPNETIVNILTYLKAIDLSSCSQIDKTIFTSNRIHESIKYQIENIYNYDITTIKHKVNDILIYKSDYLYIQEVKYILLALKSSQPIINKGYWISTSWIANSRKYYESLPLPDLNIIKKKGINTSNKKTKIRIRRGSDALPPWPCINEEICCSHGNLLISKGLKGKRRVIDSKSWKLLRSFYPQGPEFKYPKISECNICLNLENNIKISSKEHSEVDVINRLPESLLSLYNRKNGIPNESLVKRNDSNSNQINESVDHSIIYSDNSSEKFDSYMKESDSYNLLDNLENYVIDESIYFDSHIDTYIENYSDCYIDRYIDNYTDSYISYDPIITINETKSNSIISNCPLLPGVYILISRDWLKLLRKSMKTNNLTNLPVIDNTCLLCPTHNKLIIPPHLIDYFHHNRKYLLTNLNDYKGLIIELITYNEWVNINKYINNNFSEFFISFSYDGIDMQWSVDVCYQCDPINYNLRSYMNKKSHNKQTNHNYNIIHGIHIN